MTLRSPAAAMLWELWRVTRVEAALKLAAGAVVPLAVVTLSSVFAASENTRWYEVVMGNLALLGKMLVYLPHLWGWVSLAALSGGRLGFPFNLHYTRPIRTAVMVGVPMAYLTAVTFAICLVSALLLNATAGYGYSPLPAAAWIAVLTVVLKTIGWWSRNLVVLMLGVMAAFFAGGNAIGSRLDAFPKGVDYPLTDYAVMASICLACFGLTVASVARQRRGDAEAPIITQRPGNGLLGWLVDGFRFSCPTSSPTGAQVWLDLKTRGWPVLTIGMVFAIVILLVSAVSNPIDAMLNADPDWSCQIEDCFYVRAAPPLFLVPFSLFAIFLLGGNAFGIRAKQGRRYLSPFEATQAYGTAQLVVLKLLVQSACVLAALITIGASVWISMPLLGDAVFVQMWGVPLSSRRPVVTQAFAALPGYEQLAVAIVAVFGVVIGVAVFAVFRALWTRYSHRVSIASFVLVLYGLVLAWLAVGVTVGDPGTISRLHLDVVYETMRGIATAAMVITTAYVVWRGFAEHVFTVRYAGGAVVLSAAFGAAWLTLLQMAGAQQAGMSATNAVSIVSAALLPLTASVLAPWSYSRIRHN